MRETPPTFESQANPEKEKGRIREQIKQTIAESYGEAVVIKFPGLSAGSLEKLQQIDEENPGVATPIAELFERCQTEGIKIIFDGSAACFVPAGSGEAEISFDTIRLSHLDETGDDLGLQILVMRCRTLLELST